MTDVQILPQQMCAMLSKNLRALSHRLQEHLQGMLRKCWFRVAKAKNRSGFVSPEESSKAPKELGKSEGFKCFNLPIVLIFRALAGSDAFSCSLLRVKPALSTPAVSITLDLLDPLGTSLCLSAILGSKALTTRTAVVSWKKHDKSSPF